MRPRALTVRISPSEGERVECAHASSVSPSPSRRPPPSVPGRPGGREHAPDRLRRDHLRSAASTNPTAVRFAPDGRAFVAEKSGLIKVFDGARGPHPDLFADFGPRSTTSGTAACSGLALRPELPGQPVRLRLLHLRCRDRRHAPRWGTAGVRPTGARPHRVPTGDGCVVSGRLSKLEAAGGGNTSTGTEQVLAGGLVPAVPEPFGRNDRVWSPTVRSTPGGGDGASFTFTDYGQAGSPRSTAAATQPAPSGANLSPPTAEGGVLRARTSAPPATPRPRWLRSSASIPTTGAALPDNPLGWGAPTRTPAASSPGLRNPFRLGRPPRHRARSGSPTSAPPTWEEINRTSTPTSRRRELRLAVQGGHPPPTHLRRRESERLREPLD